MFVIPDFELNKKSLTSIFILIFALIILNKMNTNIILSIILIIIFVSQYPLFTKNFNTVFEKNKTDYTYSPKIKELFKKLKKHKGISIFNYQKGLDYWKQFIKHINLLENDKLENYNQYFDNAYNYLTLSVNMINSLGVGSYDRKYIDGMKYGDYESSKNMKEINEISTKLFEEGYLLLYNLSMKLNIKWRENTNIHNKEIILDHPQPRDLKHSSYDFFV